MIIPKQNRSFAAATTPDSPWLRLAGLLFVLFLIGAEPAEGAANNRMAR